MDTLLHDLRCAATTFRKAPAFAAIAIATLAVGIGANTAIVSVIDNLLFRPPRFRHIDRVVYIFDTNAEKAPPGAEPPPSPGNVLDWRERARSFDAIVLWRNWYFSIRNTGPPREPRSRCAACACRRRSLRCSASTPRSAVHFAATSRSRAAIASSS